MGSVGGGLGVGRRIGRSCDVTILPHDRLGVKHHEGILASRDDANNMVSARFYQFEGTKPVFDFWLRYIGNKA